MTFNLIFGFILVILVQSTEGGYNWVGTFKINGTCDATACCCPDTSLTFTNTGTALASSFRSQGLCKTAQHDISPNATQYELINVDHGTFTLTNNDTIMVVTLVQNNNNPVPSSCKIMMIRDDSLPTVNSNTTIAGGTGVTNTITIDSNATTIATIVVTGNNSITTDSKAANATTGVTGKGAAVTTGNKNPVGSSSAKPPGNPESDALSNYGSIWMKFFSILMATIFVKLV